MDHNLEHRDSEMEIFTDYIPGIFLENKFRGGKSSLSKIEGGRTLIILKSILSLRHNSRGAKPFSGGQNVPFALPRKIPKSYNGKTQRCPGYKQ